MGKRALVTSAVLLFGIGGPALGCVAVDRGESEGDRGEVSLEAPIPSRLDTLPPLEETLSRISACGQGEAGGARPNASLTRSDDCVGILYVWSSLMPLSRRGIRSIATAAERLGVDLTLVDADALRQSHRIADPWTESDPGPGLASREDSLVRAIVAAGATVHSPAIVVHRDGQLVGTAILGYKTADAYRHLVEQRLTQSGSRAPSQEEPLDGGNTSPMIGSNQATGVQRDYWVAGDPGAYFRSVPGRDALAFEADHSIHLLDLRSGRTDLAPGYVDFVPTPDGRLFVTPRPNRSGLAFYSAEQVFEAIARGEGRDVQPLFTDPDMTDQYPSAGVLHSETGAIVYRVLTSWFDRVVFRDYEVHVEEGESSPEIRSLGEPVVGCPDRQVSIPILSRDGRELAARDEATSTTKIFRLEDSGECDEVLDLGLQTGKVAFGSDGTLVAFAIPRGTVGPGPSQRLSVPDRKDVESLAGIFVLDRTRKLITRVRGSQSVYRLAFPDFVGRDSVVFLLARTGEDRSRFRLVCCVR